MSVKVVATESIVKMETPKSSKRIPLPFSVDPVYLPLYSRLGQCLIFFHISGKTPVMCVSTNFVYIKGKGLTNASLQSLIILTDISS